MTRLALLLALPLVLTLVACEDPTTGATPASEPSGVGLSMNADGVRMAVEAGLDGMGFGMSTPEGDQVRMGMRADAESAAMGVALDAADGTGLVLEVAASETGARVGIDLR